MHKIFLFSLPFLVILIISCPVVQSLIVTNSAGINISMWGLLHHLLCPILFPNLDASTLAKDQQGRIKQKATSSIIIHRIWLLILYKITNASCLTTKQRNQWNIMEKERLMSEQQDLFLASAQSLTNSIPHFTWIVCVQS